MPIQVNQLDPNALAALASMRTVDLRLKPPGPSWDQVSQDTTQRSIASDQVSAQMFNEAANRQNELTLQGMKGSAEMMVQKYIADRTLATQKQQQLFQGAQNQAANEAKLEAAAIRSQPGLARAQEEANYHGALLGIQQQNANTNQQKALSDVDQKQQELELNKQKAEVEAISKLSEQERFKLAGVNTTFLALNKSQDPNARSALGMTIDRAVKEGVITQDQANDYKQNMNNPDYLNAMFMGELAKTQTGNQLAGMMKVIEGQQQNGTSINIDPEGGISVQTGGNNINGSGKAGVAQAGSQPSDMIKFMNNLADLSKNYNKDMSTLGGQAESKVGSTLSYLGQGGLGKAASSAVNMASSALGTPNADQMKLYSQKYSQVSAVLNNILLEWAGMQPRMRPSAPIFEYLQKTIPELEHSDPNELAGKIQAIIPTMKLGIQSSGMDQTDKDKLTELADKIYNNFAPSYEAGGKESESNIPESFGSKEEFDKWKSTASESDIAAVKEKFGIK